MNRTSLLPVELEGQQAKRLTDEAVLRLAISRLSLDEQADLFRHLFQIIKDQDSGASGQLLIELFGVQFWPMKWGDR